MQYPREFKSRKLFGSPQNPIPQCRQVLFPSSYNQLDQYCPDYKITASLIVHCWWGALRTRIVLHFNKYLFYFHIADFALGKKFLQAVFVKSTTKSTSLICHEKCCKQHWLDWGYMSEWVSHSGVLLDIQSKTNNPLPKTITLYSWQKNEHEAALGLILFEMRAKNAILLISIKCFKFCWSEVLIINKKAILNNKQANVSTL